MSKKFPPQFPVHTIAAAAHVSPRKPRRVVTPSGRAVRGHFPSFKVAPRPATYESLIEESALRVLEVAPLVLSFSTHQHVLELKDADGEPFHYTPDATVLIRGRVGYVEVKPDRALVSRRQRARLERVVQGMKLACLPLWVLLESDLRADDLQEELQRLLHARPAPLRAMRWAEHSSFDPHGDNSTEASLLASWEHAKATCDALLARLMKRDPDALFEMGA